MIDIGSIVIFLGVLLVSVTLHEMMHAYVALRLGDDLAHAHGRISFNPLSHIDPILTIGLPAFLLILGQPPILAAKPVPINTSRIKGEDYGLAIVGIAGPLTNLALAFLFGFVLKTISFGGLGYDIIELFVTLNVALFVFNMLPIPPLDGSRLLYAFAPEPVQNFMRQIENLGIFGLVLILLLILPLISPLLTNANEIILRIVA
jgi:Zn-dependent protease